MVNRSLKTLALRLDLHMKNAFKVAKFLENHALVEKVFHPALKSHPQHDIACGQSYGHSGVFSFLLKNDEKVENFLNSLRIFLQIESPGGFESFMKAIDGATEGRKLIIVSIGLENVEDLIGDVKFAMKFIEWSFFVVYFKKCFINFEISRTQNEKWNIKAHSTRKILNKEVKKLPTIGIILIFQSFPVEHTLFATYFFIEFSVAMWELKCIDGFFDWVKNNTMNLIFGYEKNLNLNFS